MGTVAAMRIFLAGASGVIGRRLLPLLVGAGHDVAGLTRSAARSDELAAAGATPVVADVYDAETLTAAVVAFGPDAVLHQLTDLPDDAAELPAYRDRNARMRREGTANLLAAARAAGAERIVAQSVAWQLTGEGAAAVEALETSVLDAGGVVVRYGQFYGPGTFHPDGPPDHPRIHIDDAATRTLPALTMAPGILTVIED